MNFIEAMQHVAENERTAVILPEVLSEDWETYQPGNLMRL